MKFRARVALGLACSLVSSQAAGQSIISLVLEGDPVPGVGAVWIIRDVTVNDAGSWLVQVETDSPDPDANEAVLLDGNVLLTEDQLLAAPPGARIDTFWRLALDSQGRMGFAFDLSGTAGAGDDAAILRDSALVMQARSYSAAPEVTPGTQYLQFYNVQLDGAGNLFTVAWVNDPGIAGPTERVLARFELDAAGAVVSEHVLWKEGDLLPGQSEVIKDIGAKPDVNQLGQVIFKVDLAGDLTKDMAVYLDDVLLAQEGSASPVPGRTWRRLVDSVVGVNDHGDYAFSGTLSGATDSDEVLVKNGSKLVQQGDPAPGFAPAKYHNFGQGPVLVGNDGRVLWFGTWIASVQGGTGLYLDQELVVHAGGGDTRVDGQLITGLYPFNKGYDLSRSGRYVIFKAFLEDGREGAFLYDSQGAPAGTFCFGDGSGTACACGNAALGWGGCANSTGQGGTLSSTGTGSVTQDDIELHAQNLPASQPALLFAGTLRVNGGLGVPFGDGLRCAGTNVLRVGVSGADSDGSVAWGPGLAAAAGFVAGELRHFQAWYRDPIASPCGNGFNLSNGFSVTFTP